MSGVENSLISFSSFLAAAVEHRQKAELICVISDARRKELFFAAFKSTRDGKLALLSEEDIIPASHLPARIASLRNQENLKSHLIISPSAGPLKELIPSGLEIIESKCMAENLCWLGRGSKAAYSIEALGSHAPNYVRRPAARTIAERQKSPNFRQESC